jgi:hypothetical protein
MPESNYMVAKSRERLQVRWHCMVCKEAADVVADALAGDLALELGE